MTTLTDEGDAEPVPLGRLVSNWLAIFSLAAGAIHFAVIADHFDEYWLSGVFFIVAAWMQTLWAVQLLRDAAPRWVLLAGGFGNAAVAAIWIISRTSGLPVGPGAGEPEGVGFADTLATTFELLIIAGTVIRLRSALPHPLVRRRLMAGTAAMALVVVPLTSVSLALLPGHGAQQHASIADADTLFRPLPVPLARNGEVFTVSHLGTMRVLLQPYPPHASTRVEILLNDEAGRPIEDAQVVLRYDMRMSHGAGASSAQLGSVGIGTYAAELRFHMAGGWILTFTIQTPSERGSIAVDVRIPFG